MFLKKKNETPRNIPGHIAIIMDGNGRWAKKRGMPRSVGHIEGAKKFKEIARYCNKIGVKFLTVYAFYTENWKFLFICKVYLNKLVEKQVLCCCF